MGRKKDVTDFQKGAIVTAKKLGHKNVDIAEAVGCSKTTVTRVLADHKSGKITKKRPGRPRILTTPKRKALKSLIVKDKDSRRQNLSQITKAFAKMKEGDKVSERTIQRALADEGIRSCIPRRKPLISAANRNKRPAWCMERADWTVEDWKKVVWTSQPFLNFKSRGGAECGGRQKKNSMKIVSHPQSSMLQVACSGLALVSLA